MFYQACSEEFLRAGELSENKGKNSFFFSAIKLHVGIIVGFFPWPEFWLWLWLFLIKFLLVCATMAGAGGICILACLEALKTHFWCSLKANIKEIECCVMNMKVRRGGIPLCCSQLVHGGAFFSKTNITFNYKIFYD